MTIRPLRKDRSEPETFGASQGDLFGAPEPSAPAAYTPKPEHVRNQLRTLLEEMKAAETWPWLPSQVAYRKERSFAHLCGLLPDTDEATRWRREIETEVARLDAAEAKAE